jgi:zinc protease
MTTASPLPCWIRNLYPANRHPPKQEPLMRINFSIGLLLLLSGISLAHATPRIQQWQSASGARVYFVENHDIPMLDVSVDFAAGSGFDLEKKQGVAGLSHDLMDLGAAQLSEDDIAKQIADLGAQLGGHFDTDRAGISLRTLSSPNEREAALAVMAAVLQTPTFPEAILQREKNRSIAALKEAETKPESIASKAFNQAVFGAHPYGAHPEVTDVENIKRDDLLNFYRSHYAANGAIVALMGDITRAEAEAIAQRLTANLPAGGASRILPTVTLNITASEQRIDHPASQSHILMGAPGIARNDPDYFPLYVGNYILGGGGFVSRLMHEIREQRGMAYSVYSYFMPMQQVGAFQIGLQTKKEQADDALKYVRLTLNDFVKNGLSEAELKAAKQNIIGGFPLRIDSNKKILDYLSVIGFYQLPLTYLDDFSAKIDAVTTQQIREAFQRRVHPNAMATVIVGAPQGATK